MLAASILSGITDALTEIVGDHGIYAVFALMLLDAMLPAASELVMVYAGAVSAGAFAGQNVVVFGEQIDSEPWAYIAMATAGAVGYIVGSAIGWGIGYYGGRPFLERHGRWVHVTPRNLHRAEAWFDRFGDWAVLIGRVTPVVRSFIAIPAGVFEMPFLRYLLLTIPGSIVWAFAFGGAGWAFGSQWEDFHQRFHYADYVVAGAIVLFVAGAVVRHRRETRMERRAQDPAG